jgi:uncharacterized protein (DUF1800 family)
LVLFFKKEHASCMDHSSAFIALNRFGLGARPGEADRIAADPRAWLLDQVGQPAAPIRGVGDAPSRFHALDAWRRARSEQDKALAAGTQPTPLPATPPAARAGGGPPSPLDNPPGKIFDSDLIHRAEQMAASDAPFADRLAAFWSNHFAISGTRDEILVLAVPYENEAIRPHLAARFRDMLEASATHPAMLLYLDEATSVGPGSAFGQHRHRAANENYAREIMELHTLGVGGGYTQADVEALALAFTGLGLDAADGEGVWFFDRHEPGDRVLLGRHLAGGRDQMAAALDILANHPATIRHVCTKLAAHFCGDTPPRAVVRRLAEIWRGSHGSLAALHAGLIASPEAWAKGKLKYRTPQDFVLASARALKLTGRGRDLLHEMRILGHGPFKAPAPTGWPDQAADWLDPAGVTGRVGSAQRLAALAPHDTDAAAMLAQAAMFADGSASVGIVLTEPDARRAVALVLASAEFQRR